MNHWCQWWIRLFCRLCGSPYPLYSSLMYTLFYSNSTSISLCDLLSPIWLGQLCWSMYPPPYEEQTLHSIYLTTPPWITVSSQHHILYSSILTIHLVLFKIQFNSSIGSSGTPTCFDLISNCCIASLVPGLGMNLHRHMRNEHSSNR